MSRLEKMRLVRREVQAEAAERFQARTSEREISKSLIAENGPGSADSEIRQQIYRQRIANIKMLREISPRIPLPLGIERKIGQWDPILVAPNEIARKAGRPVARIVELGGQGIVPEGFATGFLVAPDLILTNWHVFPNRSEADGCAANFLYEKTPQGTQVGVSFELEPHRFYISDETLDFALVGVKTTAAAPENLGQIALIEATPKILKGEAVNIIQYPEGGPKQYGVAQNRLVDILDDGYLHYETDTLEGSSGSPAFSSNWELVALHHASIPLMLNGKVIATDGSEWTEDMGDDRVRWIANEGIRVSSLVKRLRTLTASNPSEDQILRSLIATTGDPVAEALGVIGQTGVAVATSHRTASMIVGESTSMSGVNFTFTGPVTINVMSSAPVAQSTVETTRTAGEFAPEKAIRFDPDYDNRNGYDPRFLHDDGAISVPVPLMPDDLQADLLLGDDGKPLVLKYHHFELVMNRKRRLQAWSAVNIDYSPSRKKEGDRKMWGSDKWIPDPRIPAKAQIFDADFYKPAGNIDRGHIVRREDNEWGDSDLELEYANSDTFHWTNCTPQHEAFNQSSPKGKIYAGMEGIWGAFENHIQQSRKDGDTRACILAGPILTDRDPSEDFGLGEIQYPLRFWKIVCVAEGPEQKNLKAFGFILNQSDVVKRFGIETFRPGRFKRFQVSLNTIAGDTGLKFDQLLLDADTMKGQADLELADMKDVRGL